jgi:putative ABC transport system ATP-binding protein
VRYLEGEPIGRLSDDEATRLRRERTGFVFQSFNLVPCSTSWRTWAFRSRSPAKTRGRGSSPLGSGDAIALVELDGKERHKPEQSPPASSRGSPSRRPS